MTSSFSPSSMHTTIQAQAWEAAAPAQRQDMGQRRPASLLGRLRFLLHLLARQGMVVVAGAGIGSGAAMGALLLLPHQAAQANDTTSKHIRMQFPSGGESPFTILENLPLVPNRGTIPYQLEVIFSSEPSGPVTISATVPAGLILIENVTKYRQGGDPFRKTYKYNTVGWERGHISLGVRVEAENNNTIGKNKDVFITFEFEGGGYDNMEKTLRFIIEDDDELTLSKDSLEVREGGSNSYTVKLSNRPNSSVVVNVDRASGSGVTTSPARLTFTTSNWDREQTVTVKAADDASGKVRLTHGVRIENETSKSKHSVDVTVPGVTISPKALTVENGDQENESKIYTVKLKTQPDGDVTVIPSRNPAVEVSPPALTFNTSNWDTAQTVTVTGNTVQRDTDVTVSHQVSGYGSVKTADSVTVKVIPSVPIPLQLIDIKPRNGQVNVIWEPLPAGASVKRWEIGYGKVGRSNWLKPIRVPGGSATTGTVPNLTNGVEYRFRVRAITNRGKSEWSNIKNATPDTIKLVLSPANLNEGRLEVGENDTKTYSMRLNVQPGGIVNVSVKSNKPTKAKVQPETLTFNQRTWDQFQSVTVSGEDDPGANNEDVTVSHTVDYGITEEPEVSLEVKVKVIDDDTPGVKLSKDGILISEMPVKNKLTINEGSTATYTVELDTMPSDPVTVTPRIEYTTSSVTSSELDISSATPLTFTPSTWNKPQKVIITSTDDHVDTESNKSVQLFHDVLNYGDGVRVDPVTVEIIDDDVVGVTISERTFTVTEAEGDRHSATYTVALGTKPSGPVTIIALEDKPKVDLWPRGLVFDQGNWNIPKTVTITGKGDDPDANDENVTIKYYASGYDSRVTPESIGPLNVTVIDSSNAPAKPTSLSPSPGDGKVVLTWEAESDTSITGWQVQHKKGSGDWPTNWDNMSGATATTRTHTVTGLENGAKHHFRIRARNYAGDGVASDTVSARPTAAAAPITQVARERVAAPSIVRVVEGSSANTAIPVVLRFLAKPTGNVTVRAAAPSGKLVVDGANSSNELTKIFDPANWASGEQSVTFPVYAVNNKKTGESTSVDLTLYVNGPGFDNEQRTVRVEIVDNDANHVVVSHGDLKLQEGESASYAVSLSKEPTADVTVNIGGVTDDLRVTPSRTLTFTTGNWDVRKTVTVTAVDDIETSSVVTLTHSASGYGDGGTVKVELGVGGDSLSGSALTLAEEEPDHQDAARAAKARGAELAGTSRALLGMASDRLGARLTGAAAMGGGGGGEASLGDQAWGVVENLLGINGNQLPTDLDLEQMGERLWSQSFQISAGGGVAQAEGISSGGKGSWTLWGAGDLRSYRGDAEEHISFSGSLKTGWLGLDHRFNEQWLAGLAVSHSSGESDYTYRKVSGATDGGKLSNELTAFYPYGAVQLSERLRLWALAGFGFGSQRHQSNEGGEKAEGKLRTQMGVVGFTHKLDDVGALQLALAGDVALARSTTDWPSASGLQDVEVSLSRARLGVDTRFPLTEQVTGYLNVKGRLDGGELEMGAAEMLAGLHYNGGRFSGSLQGQQVYAFDGSYGESGVSAQLRFRSQPDGTGLAWEIQPSYGYDAGTFALGGEQVSLWSDEQLASLSGGGDGAEGGGQMELSSRLGYGIRLWDGERLLTPFTELRLGAGGSRSVGLGLSLSTPSWEVELKGASEGGSGRAATGKVDLTFSRKL